MNQNFCKCALCEKFKESSELILNPCTKHCTCNSCYELPITDNLKSNNKCSGCEKFYERERSFTGKVIRKLALANNGCSYCGTSECDEELCKRHKPCKICRKFLLKFKLEGKMEKCFYCWRVALFFCKLCGGLAKINERFSSSTCKDHFFCRQCCQNIKKEVYNICTACGNECQTFITSYVNNSYNEIPQSLENYQNHNMPQRFVQSSPTLYPELTNQTYHQNYNMPQRLVQNSETLYPEPINQTYHQNYNNTITSNTIMGNNYLGQNLGNTINQPNLDITRNALQLKCNHPSPLDQIKNKFEKDFLELIQKLNANDIIFLNSKNYGLHCLEETCPIKFCFSFDMVQDIAFNIVRNYGINERFVFHYKLLFEGIKMKFANCQKCRFCTGFFEFNDYCLWCALGVVN